MIGVSLRYRNQLRTDDPTLSVEALLPKLWERGVRSIEIRGLSAGSDPVEALRSAELLWNRGFYMTVHSGAKTVESAVEDVFGPLSEILAHLRQRELILTLHPIVGDNVQMLIALSDHIRENRLPVRIALENNRRMPDKTNGNSAELVLEAVTKADRGNVGICFDMGHWAWYTANLTDGPNMLPPKEFLARTIHTHIHAYTDSGADVYGNSKGATHFPLVEWQELLSLYMDALSPTFFGVYNLELTPGRFAHLWSAEEGYLLSADTLLRHYPPRSAHYDELREHYDERVGRALDFLRETDGCYGTLLSPASYLFSTHGYRWAMDLSFMHLRKLATVPSRVRELLGDLSCMILTHAHGDHMEERTIRALADTEMLWVLPDFLVDRVRAFGVREEKIRSVRAGDLLSVGPLQIRVLEGRHFRPGTRSGAESVGYRICVERGPVLAFPGDVRDYRCGDGNEPLADHCFAHVWLTDRAQEPAAYLPKSREFAEFMLTQSKKSIFLAHLNIHRSDDKRWTEHHAQVAKDAILERSPETAVCVPRYGEILAL